MLFGIIHGPLEGSNDAGNRQAAIADPPAQVVDNASGTGIPLQLGEPGLDRLIAGRRGAATISTRSGFLPLDGAGVQTIAERPRSLLPVRLAQGYPREGVGRACQPLSTGTGRLIGLHCIRQRVVD